MSQINLMPPVRTKDPDIDALQRRFDGPLRQLASSPWGDGVLVTGIKLNGASGQQVLRIPHGLGRPARGAVIWNASVEVYGPWGLITVDANTSLCYVQVPHGGNGGFVDVWVG